MHPAPGPDHIVAGRYRLLDQLGRGAMGIVWRGQDDLLDREVAVKQIVLTPLASAAEAQTSYQRTLREARTAARLSHPGVVTVFDVVEEDGTPWIVMELVRARPLDQVIAEDGPLPPAQAAQLGLDLVYALTAAHAAGVLHRDIKPSNVLVKPDGKAVLTDFGIATVEGDPALTQAGMVVGTPGFSSPERVRGASASPASDLWSLGATLYAAVEGRGPFDRAGGSAAIVASIATEPAPRAPSAGPLATVIDALLRSDPAQRPDLATTARLLEQALSAASDPARGTGGPGGEPVAGGGSWSDPLAQPGMDATTATQSVLVPASTHGSGGLVSGSADWRGSYSGAGAAGDGASVAARTADGTDGADRAHGTDGGDRAHGTDGGDRARGTDGARGTSPDHSLSADTGRGDGGGAGADQSGAAGAISVVPDLMATPVFAELRMPVPTDPEGGRAGDLGVAGALGPARTPGPGASLRTQGGPLPGQARGRRGPARVLRTRRGLALVSTGAVTAIAAGLLLSFPSFSDSLAQGLAHLPGGAGIGSDHGSQAPGQGGSMRGGSKKGSTHQAPGTSGRNGTSGSPAPSGSAGPGGRPGPSGGPSPSGQPTTSPTPGPSQSPGPSPSATPSQSPGGSTLPLGFAWQSVSAVSVGTTAGFKVAVPATWLMTPGLSTVFKPPTGLTRLAVAMAPFAVQGPVLEALHLQAAAIAHHRYRLYHLVSILGVTFHGRPAATWTFWWHPLTSATSIDVTALIYTAKTSAGPQPFILSISAPAPRAAWASRIFRVAMRTFTPLP